MRGQAALDSCERTAAHALACTHVRDRVRRRGAMNAHHRVERASDLLMIAHGHLSEAIADLNAATILLQRTPNDFDGAPRELTLLSARIGAICLGLAYAGVRLAEASEEVLALAEAGVGPQPKVEPPSRPQPPPRQLLARPLQPGERIEALFQRRQRSKAAAPEDAPRNVSRGRAPPSPSDCAL